MSTSQQYLQRQRQAMISQNGGGPLLLRIVVVAEYTHVILLMFGLFVSGLLDIMLPSVLVRILSFVISGLGIGSLILLGKATEEQKCLYMLPYIVWRMIVTGLLITALFVNILFLHQPACANENENLCSLANANLANYGVLIFLGVIFMIVVVIYTIKFAKEAATRRRNQANSNDNYVPIPQVDQLQDSGITMSPRPRTGSGLLQQTTGHHHHDSAAATPPI